ncbi:RICIN domain-containing protein [Streptomyces sp. NPDC049837]|uniref:RICIN domain-containing protein n=1 Tax=Streptomyces sp. NPDC049837 TaxID=3155277 RepID=UPI00342D3BA4
MSRITRAALAVGATVAVLAGTATAVQADGGTNAGTAAEAARSAAEKARQAAAADPAADAAAAAREAMTVAAAVRSEALSRTKLPQTVVQITAAHSGKCLDVEGAKTTDGIDVQQYTCNGSDAQKWTAFATVGGSFELHSVRSGKCLEVEKKGTTPGAVVQQWACGQEAHQRWQLTLVDPVRKLYELQPMHTVNMCLDVPSAKKDNGINTQLWTCNRSDAQLWQVQQAK